MQVNGYEIKPRANLPGANLRKAYLCGADLYGAYLCGAYLYGAYLCGADLCGANLSGAYLRKADLYGADLSGAYLCGAKNIPAIVLAETSILPEGDLIGWKKCKEGLVKLSIPADAKRSNATGRKCRAEYALVLETPDNAPATSERGGKYIPGEIVRPDSWDENRWNECSHGIHFFITREEAENW